MALAFAEVFETATFYAHFDVVKEGDASIPRLTVRVCDSLTCAMFGAEELLETLQRELASDAVRVVRAPCVGLCDHAPAVEVGHNFLHKANLASVKAAVEAGDTHAHIPGLRRLRRLSGRRRLPDPRPAPHRRPHRSTTS